MILVNRADMEVINCKTLSDQPQIDYYFLAKILIYL